MKNIEDFIIFRTLDKMVINNEEEMVNFKNHIFDKNGNIGYLTTFSNYYIFTPVDKQSANIKSFINDEQMGISLEDYVINNFGKSHETLIKSLRFDNIVHESSTETYSFDKIYYDSRGEFDIVGAIDKEYDKYNRLYSDLSDVFKIREKTNKNSNLRRGKGINTFIGIVCKTRRK